MTSNDYYISEADLVRGLKEGDENAFRFLVEKYQDKVIRTSVGFLHSMADAEDIAQDLFIDVFLSVHAFRGESSLSTWIYRMAVNKSLNFLRGKKRKTLFAFFENLTDEKGTPQVEPSSGKESCPDNEVIKTEMQKALDQALNKLPVKQRTAFILSKYDNLPYAEIAKVMKTSVSSVESLIFRAKQNLQKRLYLFYMENIS